MKYFIIIIYGLLASTSFASERTKAGYRKPSLPLSEMERALVKEFNELNSDCRGGLGDDPKTMKACERRDHLIGPKLDKRHINPFNYNLGN